MLDASSEKYPNITSLPRILAFEGVRRSVVFSCSFQFVARRLDKAQFQVNWFRPVTFFGGRAGRISVFSEKVRESPSRYTATIGEDIPLGAKVMPRFLNILVKGSFLDLIFYTSYPLLVAFCSDIGIMETRDVQKQDLGGDALRPHILKNVLVILSSMSIIFLMWVQSR